MPEITIYTKLGCSYCSAAKELLARKHLTFREINIGGNADARAVMIGRSGGRTTVPQIFVGTTHIGGCDDLYELDAKGYLDVIIREATEDLAALAARDARKGVGAAQATPDVAAGFVRADA